MAFRAAHAETQNFAFEQVYKHAAGTKSREGIFLEPFHFLVWIIILLAVPVVGFFVWCLDKVGQRNNVRQRELRRFGESVWHTYGALLAQGISNFVFAALEQTSQTNEKALLKSCCVEN